MKVDTAWFNAIIAKSPYGSQRRLARKIMGRHGKALDASALSLMLRGKRQMQIDEARQLADLLDVPLVEVIQHAGIETHEEGAQTIPVFGYIDNSGELKTNGSPSKHSEVVQGPSGLPPGAVAIRCRTPRSELGNLDGWIIFVEKPAPPSPNLIGRLCAVETKGGKAGLGHVARGYQPSTFNIQYGFCGPARQAENVRLTWAAPVLWVRPQQ